MKKAYYHAMRKYMIAAIAASAGLIACAALPALNEQYTAAALQGALGLAILIPVLIISKKRKEDIAKYLQKIVNDEDGVTENMIMSVPMPMVICSIDGTIRWYNDLFSEIMSAVYSKLKYETLDECVGEIKWSDVLKNPNGKTVEAVLGEKTYSVSWRMMKDRLTPNKMGDHYSVFFFFKDITREKQLEADYENERVDVAMLNIDNYDEFVQKADDEVQDVTSSKIRSAIASWVKIAEPILKKTDRDRYFIAFEHQNLEKLIKGKFDIIETVKLIAEEINFPLSVSIGIGTKGSLAQNEISARQALDMALGRGGGQVCIKDDVQFKFYGGKISEYERSTRVKARAVATALSDFIRNSDNVIFMGHSGADYDCFGAAVGLQRAVRMLGAVPYIVKERVSPAIETMYEGLRSIEEYQGMFVDENEAAEEVTPNTLLVVLDTHRPSMLPCRKLLEKVSKVVLIDHHRRSTEFISSCSLVYHEPYASSTCEMATELIEYMDAGNAITKIEAQCLYTGILMDTKNFMLKTGVRTFEAASYLRKLGLDTVAVRRMFSSSISDYALKAQIVSNAELITKDIALSKTDRIHPNMRLIASQAADDMLNIENVAASIVVYQCENGIGFSARSLGGVNVQLIMENLGGGGHMTVSGAFMKDISLEEGVTRAKQAVKHYIDSL